MLDRLRSASARERKLVFSISAGTEPAAPVSGKSCFSPWLVFELLSVARRPLRKPKTQLSRPPLVGGDVGWPTAAGLHVSPAPLPHDQAAGVGVVQRLGLRVGAHVSRRRARRHRPPRESDSAQGARVVLRVVASYDRFPHIHRAAVVKVFEVAVQRVAPSLCMSMDGGGLRAIGMCWRRARRLISAHLLRCIGSTGLEPRQQHMAFPPGRVEHSSRVGRANVWGKH